MSRKIFPIGKMSRKLLIPQDLCIMSYMADVDWVLRLEHKLGKLSVKKRRKLAVDADWKPETLRKYLQNRNMPGADMGSRLARVVKCSPDWLFNGFGNPDPPATLEDAACQAWIVGILADKLGIKMPRRLQDQLAEVLQTIAAKHIGRPRGSLASTDGKAPKAPVRRGHPGRTGS